MDKYTFIFILILGFLLFLFFIILLIYNPKLNNISECPINYCKISLINGVKTCPDENEKIQFVVGKEACTQQYMCDVDLYPYAINEEGTTNIGLDQSVCPINVQCNCSNKIICPSYVSSIFVENNGNLLSVDYRFVDEYRDTTHSCTISPQSLSLIGCGGGLINQDYISTCMGLSSDCSNIGEYVNPCETGNLAFIINDNNQTIDYAKTPLVCIDYDPCPCGGILTYNTSTNTTNCI